MNFSRTLQQLKFLVLFLSVTGCAALAPSNLNSIYGPSSPKDRLVPASTPAGAIYQHQVKPILENRCVVCHGCYDAPCQLKLSSPAGIDRGASKKKVYNSRRLLAADTTRLLIDAHTTEQWRSKKFYPVLNEHSPSPETNKQASVLYQLLKLKHDNPTPPSRILPDDAFDLSLKKKHDCPNEASFEDYAQKNPLAGMPYGLPALNQQAFNTLESWVESGALMSNLPKLQSVYRPVIRRWEAFLNGDSIKERLVARYIYEHLFLANIYFDKLPPGEHFKLVRSTTPPGEPINIIATRRPYDDPNTYIFYYRLQRVESSILSKTHLPYALNDARMSWIKKLFFEPEYEVPELPSYDVEVSSNPFKAFKHLPARSRYRFMLAEAQFTIMGFMKGPVCRGQVALNVIDDHFWVFFVNPDEKALSNLGDFVQTQSDNLRLPAESESNSGVLLSWFKYSGAQTDYLMAKSEALEKGFPGGMSLGLNLIWDGDKSNKNAALTVFRHYDSASVIKGLHGQNPKTSWLIDYPILERIHYLLVAGFDVYGNIGHQLNTRLYMDFLRLESEFNFLALLPQPERIKLRDYWYRDVGDKVKSHLYGCRAYLDYPPDINYVTNDPQKELYSALHSKLSPVLFEQHSSDITPAHKPLQQVLNIKGTTATLLPEVAFLMVERDNDQQMLYTVLRNSGHSNLTSLFKEQSNRLPEEDYITILQGLVGAYPDVFWKVHEKDLSTFANKLSSLKNESDYKSFMDTFGVRRNSPEFWKHSDQLHTLHRKHKPREYGLLDYNRLENR